jgi:hypothetical protein
MKIEIDEEELLRLHRAGATQGEIAAYFGCYRTTIGNRLRKLGVHTGQSGKRASRWKGGERLDSEGYVLVWRPGHPRADIQGYVKRCILAWEGYHGRPFPEGRVPHHLDGDSVNDDPTNIVSLLPSEHSMVTRREDRAKRQA